MKEDGIIKTGNLKAIKFSISNMHVANFKNWHFSRRIVLLAGLFFSGQAIYYVDAVPALLGAFLIYQSLTGKGCLVYGSCITDMEPEEIEHDTARSARNIEYTTTEEN